MGIERGKRKGRISAPLCRAPYNGHFLNLRNLIITSNSPTMTTWQIMRMAVSKRSIFSATDINLISFNGENNIFFRRHVEFCGTPSNNIADRIRGTDYEKLAPFLCEVLFQEENQKENRTSEYDKRQDKTNQEITPCPKGQLIIAQDKQKSDGVHFHRYHSGQLPYPTWDSATATVSIT